MNNWTIIGRLGKDAEVKQSKNGSLLIFPVAVDRSYKTKDGEKVDKVQWVECLQSLREGKSGLQPYMKKGCIVAAEGVPYPNAWSNDAGEINTKQCMSVKAVSMVTWPEKDEAKPQNKSVEPDLGDDGLPF